MLLLESQGVRLLCKHSVICHLDWIALKVAFAHAMMPAPAAVVLAPDQVLAALVGQPSLTALIQLDMHLVFVSVCVRIVNSFLLLIAVSLAAVPVPQPQKPKCLFVVHTHVINLRVTQTVQIVVQMPQLFVHRILEVGKDRNAIIHIQGKAQCTIVDQDQVTQLPVAYDTQILNQAILRLNAVMPVQPRGE